MAEVNQAQAMRDALTELGLDAKNDDLNDWLKKNRGFEPKNINVLKSNAKKSLAKSGNTSTLFQDGEAAKPAPRGTAPIKVIPTEPNGTIDALAVLEDAEAVRRVAARWGADFVRRVVVGFADRGSGE